ncbi:MAG TPA: hypothetical protein VJ876_08615 [Bacteroidales bacterium]|nr:hypothetical protein [Bacteroidales bacterium]
MTEEKSAIEELTELAKRSGRELKSSEQAHKTSTPIHPVTYHRRKVYMANKENATSFFCWYADSTEFGDYRLFSGAFIPLDLPRSCQLKIRKKDVLDRWNPFRKTKSLKTGSGKFDGSVVVTAHDDLYLRSLLFDGKIQQRVLEVLDMEPALKVGVNLVNLDFVPSLQDRSHLGLFFTQHWEFKLERVERLFQLIERFREQVNA